MLISIIFLICIGWVLGVHLPWYCILASWVGGLYRVSHNKEGLGGFRREFLIIALVIFPMILSGFIYGDVTFVDIGETIKYLFTGG